MLIVILLAGLLIIGVSIPMALEKVKPNVFCGFRVAKTFSDEKIWYKANKYMGKCFIWSYSIAILASLPLLAYQDKISYGWQGALVTLLILLPAIYTVIASFIYLGKLEPESATEIDMKELGKIENKAFSFSVIAALIGLIAMGVLMAGLGIPLVLDKVGPNGSYGVRVAKTLNDEAIWYQANRFGGWSLLVTGFVQVAIGVYALARIKKLKDWVGLVIGIGGLHLPFITVVAILIYVGIL